MKLQRWKLYQMKQKPSNDVNTNTVKQKQSEYHSVFITSTLVHWSYVPETYESRRWGLRWIFTQNLMYQAVGPTSNPKSGNAFIQR